MPDTRRTFTDCYSTCGLELAGRFDVAVECSAAGCGAVIFPPSSLIRFRAIVVCLWAALAFAAWLRISVLLNLLLLC